MVGFTAVGCYSLAYFYISPENPIDNQRFYLIARSELER